MPLPQGLGGRPFGAVESDDGGRLLTASRVKPQGREGRRGRSAGCPILSAGATRVLGGVGGQTLCRIDGVLPSLVPP
jgi:hypothetical protein